MPPTRHPIGVTIDRSGATEDKAAVRGRLLAARAALTAPTRARASEAIHGRLDALPELADARAVLGYAAFGSEVDLDPWLQRLADAGVGVFLPWVDDRWLRIARVIDLDADLAPGWRGVREPRVDGRRSARPDRLHAAVVPGVGFDGSGRRLGYGGGHFDRLLAEVGPGTVVVGVAFDVQLVDTLPAEPHDRPVDVVVTESRTVRGGRGQDRRHARP